RSRLSGRDRRDRHGTQSRRRSHRVRLRPQIRRLSVSQAEPGGIRPDRRTRRTRDARWHVRHHRPLSAVRYRARPGARVAHLRAGQARAMAQHRSRFLLDRRLAGGVGSGTDRERAGARANHAELVVSVYGYLMRDGRIDTDWFARQIAFADRTDGDIDTLSTRIAHIRTWTFAANRPDWLADPEHWQEVTRAVEDKLSDALHERLTERFVDRRTSVLMRRLRENAELE